MDEPETPAPAGPARRPVFDRREGAADFLLGEFAAYELGEVRSVWYSDHSAMFVLRIASGRPITSATLARIERTGEVYQAVRRVNRDAFGALRAQYFGSGAKLPVLRPALRVFANLYDSIAGGQDA